MQCDELAIKKLHSSVHPARVTRIIIIASLIMCSRIYRWKSPAGKDYACASYFFFFLNAGPLTLEEFETDKEEKSGPGSVGLARQRPKLELESSSHARVTIE